MPKFGQLFVLDSDEAVQSRMRAPQNAQCRETIMQKIDQDLRRVNPYVQAYRRLQEAASREELDASLGLLPLNAAGMLEATIIPMKGYRGFGPRS